MRLQPRIRWRNVAWAAALIAAAVAIVSVGPGLFKRPTPPPLAADIGLRPSREAAAPAAGARLRHADPRAPDSARHERPRRDHRPRRPSHRSRPRRRPRERHRAAAGTPPSTE